jgi:hypothetical protein
MYGALFWRGSQMHNLLEKPTAKNMGQPIHFPAPAPEIAPTSLLYKIRNRPSFDISPFVFVSMCR